jgi:ATP-dependent RNA helicase MSS116
VLRPGTRRLLHQSTRWRQYAATQEIEDQAVLPQSDEAMAKDAAPSYITKFADLSKQSLVHDNVIKAITRNMGLETMTEVQSATINQALKGTDM